MRGSGLPYMLSLELLLTFYYLGFNPVALPSSQSGLDIVFILGNLVFKLQIEGSIIWEKFWNN